MNPETQTSAIPTPDAPIGALSLPHDLTPWGMFMNADIIVQAIMIGLFIASVITWTVLLAKGFELFSAGRAARAAMTRLANARSLDDAAGQLRTSNSDVAALSARNESPRTSIKSKRRRCGACNAASGFSRPSAQPLPSSACSARYGVS